jgi:hypothetical protein
MRFPAFHDFADLDFGWRVNDDMRRVLRLQTGDVILWNFSGIRWIL